MNEQDIKKRLGEIELLMSEPTFWNDKVHAQAIIKEMQDLKDREDGASQYDRGGAVLTILAGAGGDDAEDFASMLFRMYEKFCANHALDVRVRHVNENDHGGYRNITAHIAGKNAYGMLKWENGVHRLVRLSPFNADQKRHTSFALVEAIPLIEQVKSIDIPPADLDIQFSKSGGPGGQNVNKRETSVRITHIPTGISVHADTERSQESNRDQALAIIYGKLIQKAEEEKKTLEESMKISKNTSIEWGNQIRSYVLHPYKMVKDHRTGQETSNTDAVMSDGEIDVFIKAMKQLVSGA